MVNGEWGMVKSSSSKLTTIHYSPFTLKKAIFSDSLLIRLFAGVGPGLFEDRIDLDH